MGALRYVRALVVAAAIPVAAGGPAVSHAQQADVGFNFVDIVSEGNKKNRARANDQAKRLLRTLLNANATNACRCTSSLLAAIRSTLASKTSMQINYSNTMSFLQDCFGGRGVPGSSTASLQNSAGRLYDFMRARGQPSWQEIIYMERAVGKICAKVVYNNTWLQRYVISSSLPNRLPAGQAYASPLEGYRLFGPRPLASGDLDGDGLLDVVVADDDLDTATIRLANGDGTFETVQTFDLGFGPFRVFVDDIDTDGRNDVIVLNIGSEDGSLFLGNGDGTVQHETVFDPLIDHQYTVIEDLDSDGVGDQASVRARSDQTTVSLGGVENDQETLFELPTDGDVGEVLPVTRYDGTIDVIVRLGDSSDIAVFPGYGDGYFQQPMVFTYDEAGDRVETSVESGIADHSGEDDSVATTPMNTSGVTFVPAPSSFEPAPVIDRSTLTIQASPSLLLGQ